MENDRAFVHFPPWHLLQVVLPFYGNTDAPAAEFYDSASLYERYVQAAADVAETLADLASKGISHRDIKPGNLYQHEGVWKVGDFGLADYPTKEALTVPGSKLGPMHFIADEMIANADRADGESADVFSLAKTLWVLAAGQNHPPGGQLRFDIPQLRLSSYVSHPRAQILDLLIERATDSDPKRRPHMDQMAKELNAWLRPPNPADLSAGDISDLGPQLQAVFAPLQRAEDRKREVLLRFKEIPELLKNRLRVLREQIGKYYPHAQITRDPGILSAVPAIRHEDSPQVWTEETLAVVINSDRVKLSSGFGVRLTEDENLEIIAAHLLYDGKNQQSWVIWEDMREARLGSAVQEHAIAELYRGLSEHLRMALKDFIEQSAVVR